MYVGPESLLVAARIDLADDLPASAVEALADQIDAICVAPSRPWPRFSSILRGGRDDGDARQLLALQQLERRTAARRQPRHLIREPELL
jgi:hypothetical protein